MSKFFNTNTRFHFNIFVNIKINPPLNILLQEKEYFSTSDSEEQEKVIVYPTLVFFHKVLFMSKVQICILSRILNDLS